MILLTSARRSRPDLGA